MKKEKVSIAFESSVDFHKTEIVVRNMYASLVKLGKHIWFYRTGNRIRDIVSRHSILFLYWLENLTMMYPDHHSNENHRNISKAHTRNKISSTENSHIQSLYLLFTDHESIYYRKSELRQAIEVSKRKRNVLQNDCYKWILIVTMLRSLEALHTQFVIFLIDTEFSNIKNGQK